ncbi:MAG: adenosylcobalamin-dependent ribonucleoside-diphosphate reductase [Synergistaceae bacterium]|nr:adenosylcobalamin-dependent ribonucleoside-diphosphate reductase [Synergistaceae bacterium]
MRYLRNYFNDLINYHELEPGLKPRLSDNAMWLLAQRYFVDMYDIKLNKIRKESSFEEFTRRVARTVASAESAYLSDMPESLDWLIKLEKNIASDILNRRFLFNSPCLFSSAAGLTVLPEFAEIIYKNPDEMTFAEYKKLYEAKTKNQQLFACFVISVPDSIEGIFEAVKDAGIISKFGGGVGGNFGHLREQGAMIGGGTGGKASGPVSFMETWNTMGAVVVQGGKRRAALMGMLFDDHPDIEQFIDSKTEDGRLPYFNISVAISNKLMDSAKTDGAFELKSRTDGKVVKTLRAKNLLNHICESAWKRGDPGVFFIDRAQQDNLLKLNEEWKIESTNPCGEQPLPNYTSCNLGSINVEAFVKDNKFDWESFEAQVYRSIFYLDLVIDACSYPLEKIGERTKLIRPVGLGIMGLADAAILQNIIYGSQEFKDFCGELGGAMAAHALGATVKIVSDAGKSPFPESGLINKLFKKFADEQALKDLDLTQAGLALQSMAELNQDAQAVNYIFTDKYFDELTPEGFKDLLNNMRSGDLIPNTLINTLEVILNKNFDDAKFILQALSLGELRNSRRLSIAPTGSISMIMDASSGIEPNFAWSWSRKIAKVDGRGTEERDFWHKLLSPEQRIEYKVSNGKLSNPAYVTAYDISTQQHVDVTGIFAKFIDSGISKTVNLPFTATIDDVRKVYEKCYELGCKGITIYRDGSRSEQPIEAKKPEDEAKLNKNHGMVKARPGLVVFGKTIKESSPWGSIYLTLNFDGSDPFEIFINVGKSGSELKAMAEALSRVISIGLRSGCRIEDFIDTLKGLSGKEYWMFSFDEEHVARSIPDAIAILLEKLIERQQSETNLMSRTSKGDVICPECGAPMEMLSGCAYCFSCGYSPCK